MSHDRSATRAQTLETCRRLWSDALTLPGHPNLAGSLVAELTAYLSVPAADVELRCVTAAFELVHLWDAEPRASPEQINAFYDEADAYLYDLTWWHGLNESDSALIQVAALECAMAQGAVSALDFGSGIGSLGLLFAHHGMETTLADVNPRLNDYARWRFERRGLRADVVDLRHEALPDGRFDLISAIDVFEHLPEPPATMAALARALRPGGTIFLHFPVGPDPAHPMHLWESHEEVLGAARNLGLAVEQHGWTLLLREPSSVESKPTRK